VILGPGVRGDAASRNGSALQGPQEPLVPLGTACGLLDGRERLGNPLVGAVDIAVYRLARLRLEAILRVPDVQRCFLQSNVRESRGFELKGHVHSLLFTPH